VTFQTLRYTRRKRLLWKADDIYETQDPDRETSHPYYIPEAHGTLAQLAALLPCIRELWVRIMPGRPTIFICIFVVFHRSSKQTTEWYFQSDHCHFSTTDVSGFDCRHRHTFPPPMGPNQLWGPFSILFYYQGLVLGRKLAETWNQSFTSIYCQGWKRVELFLNSPILRYGVQPYFLRLPYTTFPVHYSVSHNNDTAQYLSLQVTQNTKISWQQCFSSKFNQLIPPNVLLRKENVTQAWFHNESILQAVVSTPSGRLSPLIKTGKKNGKFPTCSKR
jgi:hypothetical protein